MQISTMICTILKALHNEMAALRVCGCSPTDLITTCFIKIVISTGSRFFFPPALLWAIMAIHGIPRFGSIPQFQLVVN